jgi:hypothetical protein
MAFSATGGLASQTGISLRFFGVDQTAGAFRAVAGRIDGLNQTVAGFSARMSSLWNTALIGAAAAGFAKLGKSISQVCTELSALSDRAADAGTLSPTLQKIAGALGQIGVRGASIDTVSHAMQEMVKRTGETGAEGFAKILGEASRLETEQQRLVFLSDAFGKSMGAAFAPLVAGGEAAVRQFVELAGAYPAVSDAAAQTADRAADAMARATDAIKAGWGETAVSIVGWVEATFGPLPEVAASVARAILVSFKAVHDTFKTLALGFRIVLEPIITTVSLLIGTVSRLVRAVADTGYTLRDALSDAMDEATASFEMMVDGWSDYAEGMFDFSNIGASLETAGIFEEMRNAIGEGGVTFRTEAEKASEDVAAKTAAAIREAAPRGAEFARQGSAAAQRLIWGARVSQEDAAQRAANAAVANKLPEISDAAQRTANALTEIDQILLSLEAI